jgi:tetratricopeptide (TPR) repeat protein
MAQVLKTYMGESAAQAMLESRGTAMALFQAGRFAKVVALIEDYEARHGDAFDVLKLRLAQSYWKLGQLEKALAAYKVVVTQNAEEGAHGRIGVEKLTAQIARKADQAGDDIDPAILQKLTALDRLAQLSDALGDNPDLDWLIKYVNAAPAPKQQIVEAEEAAILDLIKFVEAMAIKGEYRRVQLRCEEGLQNWPNEPRLHWHLSWALEKQGFIKEAVLEYIKVVEIDGAHAADALRRASELTAAIEASAAEPSVQVQT